MAETLFPVFPVPEINVLTAAKERKYRRSVYFDYETGDFLRDKDPSVAALLASVNDGKITFLCACGKEAVKKGVKAGDIIKQVCAIAGGSGGGKPDSAMGGGKDVLMLDNALAMVDNVVAMKLGL